MAHPFHSLVQKIPKTRSITVNFRFSLGRSVCAKLRPGAPSKECGLKCNLCSFSWGLHATNRAGDRKQLPFQEFFYVGVGPPQPPAAATTDQLAVCCRFRCMCSSGPTWMSSSRGWGSSSSVCSLLPAWPRYVLLPAGHPLPLHPDLLSVRQSSGKGGEAVSMVTGSHPRWDGCRPCAQYQPEGLLGCHGDREPLEQMPHEAEQTAASSWMSADQDIMNVSSVTVKGHLHLLDDWQP